MALKLGDWGSTAAGVDRKILVHVIQQRSTISMRKYLNNEYISGTNLGKQGPNLRGGHEKEFSHIEVNFF